MKMLPLLEYPARTRPLLQIKVWYGLLLLRRPGGFSLQLFIYQLRHCGRCCFRFAAGLLPLVANHRCGSGRSKARCCDVVPQAKRADVSSR